MVIPIFSVGLVVGGGVMANNKMPKIRIILYTTHILYRTVKTKKKK